MIMEIENNEFYIGKKINLSPKTLYAKRYILLYGKSFVIIDIKENCIFFESENFSTTKRKFKRWVNSEYDEHFFIDGYNNIPIRENWD